MKIKQVGLVVCGLTLVAVASAHAQVWYKVAPESQSVSATLPAGAVYRFGIASGTTNAGISCATAIGCWSANQTAPLTINPVYYTTFKFVDPAPGLTKELDVLETAVAQKVVVVTGGVTATVTVPALPPPPSPPPAPAPTTKTYLVTCTSTATVTLATGAMTMANSTCAGVAQ